MEKSKLGISVSLLGAAVCFSGIMGAFAINGGLTAYILPVLLIAYVLIAEDNLWLRRTAAKAGVILFSFFMLSVFVELIPLLFGFIESLLNLFDESILGEKAIDIIARKIPNFFNSALIIAEIVLFLILGIKALGKKTLIIAPVDKMLNKHLN